MSQNSHLKVKSHKSIFLLNFWISRDWELISNEGVYNKCYNFLSCYLVLYFYCFPGKCQRPWSCYSWRKGGLGQVRPSDQQSWKWRLCKCHFDSLIDLFLLKCGLSINVILSFFCCWQILLHLSRFFTNVQLIRIFWKFTDFISINNWTNFSINQ